MKPLSGALQHDASEEIVWALGRIGDTRATGPLIAALRRGNLELGSMERALGRMGTPAVEPLVAALGDGETYVRDCAARALGWIGDDQALEPLIALLGDAEAGSAAAGAAARIGGRAFDLLVEALEDDDARVRKAAAWGLECIGDASAIRPLVSLLQDGDWSVVKAAAEALAEYNGDARALGLLGAFEPEGAARAPTDFAWRPEGGEDEAAYWAALGQWDRCVAFGEKAIAPLITALRGQQSSVRLQAAQCLGRIGDARAVEPLIAALGDREWHVSQAVVQALDELAWKPGPDEAGAAYRLARGRSRR